MRNLTKRDIVIKISNETGLIQQDVLAVIQKTLDYIQESLAKGQDVQLRNFGVFSLALRKRRVGRNPNKPETPIEIPPCVVIKFKAGKEMKVSIGASIVAQINKSNLSDHDKTSEKMN